MVCGAALFLPILRVVADMFLLQAADCNIIWVRPTMRFNPLSELWFSSQMPKSLANTVSDGFLFSSALPPAAGVWRRTTVARQAVVPKDHTPERTAIAQRREFVPLTIFEILQCLLSYSSILSGIRSTFAGHLLCKFRTVGD